MKRLCKLLTLFSLLVSIHSQAALISLDASAAMTSGEPLATTLFPVATNLDVDLDFDVGPGTLSQSDVSDVSGSFSWIDATFGPQSYEARNAFVSGAGWTGSAGWFAMTFWSSERATVGDLTATAFIIRFVNDVNVFSSPGNVTELYDLLPQSTVEAIEVLVHKPGQPIGRGKFESEVSSSIFAVPTPGLPLLLLTGLSGLFVAVFAFRNIRAGDAGANMPAIPAVCR